MNILLTSAGRRSYIVDYFKNCVGVDKVYVSNSVYTIACKRADDFFISPLIYSDEYIPSIIAYCKEKGITVVLSLFDIDLFVLAKNESSFSDAGIELVLAPSSFIEICNDKWKTYKFIKALKLKTPKTYITVDTVVEAVKRGEIRYPLIMKPRWGMASMDIYTIDDEEELRVLTNKCKKDIFNSYLKYESSMTEAQAIVYQEKISGDEYGLDILNDLNGNYVATFAKQKLAMRSGETDLGLTCESSPFETLSRTIAENSHHHGICSLDCFKTEMGVYVIEMNCRISGHYPLSYLAGFNYPQLLVDWINNKETNPDLLQYKTGLYIVKDLVPTVL